MHACAAGAGCLCWAATGRGAAVSGSRPPSWSPGGASVCFQVGALCRGRRGRRRRQRQRDGGNTRRCSGAPSGRRQPCRHNPMPAPGQGSHLWHRDRKCRKRRTNHQGETITQSFVSSYIPLCTFLLPFDVCTTWGRFILFFQGLWWQCNTLNQEQRDIYRTTVGITSQAKNALSMARAWENNKPTMESTNTRPPCRSDKHNHHSLDTMCKKNQKKKAKPWQSKLQSEFKHVWMLHTRCEGQQQQRRQAGDDGGEEKHPTPAKVVDGQTQEDAGQRSGYHLEEVAEVETGGETVQVSGEAVLDARSNEPAGDRRKMDWKWVSNPKHHSEPPSPVDQWQLYAINCCLRAQQQVNSCRTRPRSWCSLSNQDKGGVSLQFQLFYSTYQSTVTCSWCQEM